MDLVVEVIAGPAGTCRLSAALDRPRMAAGTAFEEIQWVHP